jgi:hypothetical protein
MNVSEFSTRLSLFSTHFCVFSTHFFVCNLGLTLPKSLSISFVELSGVRQIIGEFSFRGSRFLTFRTPLWCVFLAALSLSASLWAQEGGSISGTVTDTSEAVIPGAAVKVSNNAGLSRDTKTDEAGQYSVAGLPAGTYQVTISQTGFQDFTSSAVTVVAGQTARIDATLQPAEEVTSVNVAGEKVAQIETESAQLARTITQKEVTSIGLNGRNFTQLITLAPGVSNQTGQDEALVGISAPVNAQRRRTITPVESPAGEP